MCLYMHSTFYTLHSFIIHIFSIIYCIYYYLHLHYYVLVLCHPLALFQKAYVRMKRIHITCNGKYTENCWAETETSPKEVAGLH